MSSSAVALAATVQPSVMLTLARKWARPTSTLGARLDVVEMLEGLMQGADCDLVKKLPRYPQLPVTLFGRLAIDEPRKGRGSGQILLMDAMYRSLQAATAIAAIASLARHSRQVP